jgi:ribosome-binding factor A
MPKSSRIDPKIGPSQRQLRAGELVRHALVDVFAAKEIRDPDLQGVSVTVGEVRLSPDLRHAVVFVAALGVEDITKIAAALQRAHGFIRGRLGKLIDMKFTPDLKFIADTSYDEAARMTALYKTPIIARDLDAPPPTLPKDEEA